MSNPKLKKVLTVISSFSADYGADIIAEIEKSQK